MRPPPDTPQIRLLRQLRILRRISFGAYGIFFLACLIDGFFVILSNFIPSPEYVVQARPYAVTTGLLTGVGSISLIWYQIAHPEEYPESVKRLPKSPNLRILLLCFVPIFGWSLGTTTAYSAIPMIMAIPGNQGEISVVVESASGFSDRQCRNAIILRDMPFVMRRLCRFSTTFRDSLNPGDRLTVTGHGSKWGVFPRYAAVDVTFEPRADALCPGQSPTDSSQPNADTTVVPGPVRWAKLCPPYQNRSMKFGLGNHSR